MSRSGRWDDRQHPTVDQHDLASSPSEQAGGDASAVASRAVHPDRPGRQVPQSMEQVSERHVNGLLSWDTSTTGACPGGVFWEDVAGSQRNVAANGANAELGLELYLRTGNALDLTWATAMYQWVVSCLGTSNGLYNDHVNADGTINTTIWGYNQGVMAGAGVLLDQATGNSKYLTQAESTAANAVTYFGTGTTLISQGTAFNAIFFRNLFYLNQVSPNSAYASQAQSFASYMWTQRQPETGLLNPQYGVNGTAPMVEIFSLLAGTPASP